MPLFCTLILAAGCTRRQADSCCLQSAMYRTKPNSLGTDAESTDDKKMRWVTMTLVEREVLPRAQACCQLGRALSRRLEVPAHLPAGTGMMVVQGYVVKVHGFPSDRPLDNNKATKVGEVRRDEGAGLELAPPRARQGRGSACRMKCQTRATRAAEIQNQMQYSMVRSAASPGATLPMRSAMLLLPTALACVPASGLG